ncbi:hypothetical protein G6M12_19540 [Agrobacterium tumefaciens]|nr:hypothetical protein [Agrobacterium tumefaciens]
MAGQYKAQVDVAHIEIEVNRQRQNVEWAQDSAQRLRDHQDRIDEQRALEEQNKKQMLAELQTQQQSVVAPPMPNPQPPMGM